MARRFRKLEETLAHPLVEAVIFRLDPIRYRRSLLQTSSRNTHRHVQQQDEARLQASSRNSADPLKRSNVEPAPVSLIRERRIDESIAEHDFPGSQCRPNYL